MHTLLLQLICVLGIGSRLLLSANVKLNRDMGESEAVETGDASAADEADDEARVDGVDRDDRIKSGRDDACGCPQQRYVPAKRKECGWN